MAVIAAVMRFCWVISFDHHPHIRLKPFFGFLGSVKAYRLVSSGMVIYADIGAQLMPIIE